MQVNFIVGTILTSESERFQRMIFRSTKGNALVRIKSISARDLDKKYIDPKIALEKDVFIIIYPGEELMKTKLLRFCDSL